VVRIKARNGHPVGWRFSFSPYRNSRRRLPAEDILNLQIKYQKRYHASMEKQPTYLNEGIASAIESQAKIIDCSKVELTQSALEKEFSMNLRDFVPNFDLVSELDIALPDWDLSNLDPEMQGFGQK